MFSQGALHPDLPLDLNLAALRLLIHGDEMLEQKADLTADQDTEYKLTYAEQTAIVSPFGASLRRYFVKADEKEWNAVWGYEGGAKKRGGQGDVLIPFPGRIKSGAYAFNGQRHELVKNDKDGPNAIHGFVRAQTFETKKVSNTEAIFTYNIDSEKRPIPGYPFSLAIEVSYSIGVDGLTTHFQITNTGVESAPAGAGFHPYFCADVGDLSRWKVTIPAARFIEIENVIPTGRVLSVDGTPFDFRNGRVVGDARYNGCVANLDRDSDGWATAWVSSENSKRRVSIRMDENFDYVVIYTGDQIAAPDQRKGFAIEPMTCAPDAFNHEGWGVRILASGESMRGSYIIKAE
jgi:aldose 1-epimerase